MSEETLRKLLFALGIPLTRQGPQSGTRQRFNPIHTMFRDGGDAPRTPAEVAAMEGRRLRRRAGHQQRSGQEHIDKTRDKLVGRGVLLDVARHQGVRALEPGYAVTVDDLERTAAEDVSVQRSDLLLVRTGHMSRYLKRGDWRHFDLDPFPGVSVYTAPWMHARQIAAVASDNYAVEVRPSEIAGFRNPFHVVVIPNMGLTLGEIFFLEELAADCAADGRYAFLLAAPPLPVTRAVGTPINPYALN
jgi:kynurenine formamidase